jgi:hypothetical protein
LTPPVIAAGVVKVTEEPPKYVELKVVLVWTLRSPAVPPFTAVTLIWLPLADAVTTEPSADVMAAASRVAIVDDESALVHEMVAGVRDPIVAVAVPESYTVEPLPPLPPVIVPVVGEAVNDGVVKLGFVTAPMIWNG